MERVLNLVGTGNRILEIRAKAVYLSSVLRNFERVFESQVFGLKEEDWNMWDIVPE